MQKLDVELCILLHTALEDFILSNKLGHLMDNGNKLKWIIGTHGNIKSQNSGGRFGATS